MATETDEIEARGSPSLDNLQDGTYWLADGILHHALPAKGFWVATHRGTDALLDRSLAKFHPSMTGATVKAMLEAALIYNQTGTYYVGVWSDNDGNKHLDYSLHIDDLGEALRWAKRGKQLAIWDICMARSVAVKQ